MTIIIRDIEKDDKPEWSELWREYLRFYKTVVPEDVYDITFDRIIDRDLLQQNAYVAVNDGVLVGLVHFIYHPHNWRIENVCYLQDLFVAAQVRGRGVGRGLIEAVYRAADKNGTPAVYWMTQDFNKPARKLYDQVAKLTPFIKYQR